MTSTTTASIVSARSWPGTFSAVARPLVLWGATGQARVLAELVDGTDYQVAAYVDRSVTQSPDPNLPIFPGLSALAQWVETHPERDSLCAAVAIGGPHGSDRREIAAALRGLGLEVPTLIHRDAHIARTAEIAEGAQVLIGAVIGAGARIAGSTIVNSRASVDHDCVIEEGAHVGPGATLAGEIYVGEDAFIGTGAVVLPRVRIGRGAVVGAGAVVLKDVPDGATVVGNPARSK